MNVNRLRHWNILPHALPLCRIALCVLVSALIQPLFAASLPGLAGHWQFEEGSGATTADASGNGLSGTLVNGPSWVSSPLGNFALDLGASADGVDLGNPTSLQLTGAMTLSAWVNVDSLAGSGRFIAKGGASGRRGWSLNLESTGVWAFQVAANSTTVVALNASPVITNQWVHVAGVFDPDVPAMRLYIYGALVAERNDVPRAQFNSPANVFVGRRENGTEFDGRIDEVRVFNRALSGEEIGTLPEVAPRPLSFAIEPAGRTVAQFRSVTFSSKVSGSPPHFFQWLKDGQPIAGARGPNYLIPTVTMDQSGEIYAVVVSNFVSSVTSSNAVLTVTQDTNPPALVSAGSVDGRQVGVCFSEGMDGVTAADPFNYQINDGAVLLRRATLRPDGRSVLLELQDTEPALEGEFTLLVRDVVDLSGNSLPQDSSVIGRVAGMLASDVGSPTPAGSTFSCATGEFEIAAGGADTNANLDRGHTVLKSVSGDFDIHAQLTRFTAASEVARAGLMVRATFEADSPTLYVSANPAPPAGRGLVESWLRSVQAGEAISWSPPYSAITVPDLWLRLRRTGDYFSAYASSNGTQWVLLGQVTAKLTEPILLGLAATARNSTESGASAAFRSYRDTTFNGASLTLSRQPGDTAVPQNSTATFTVAATGTGAPESELIYQWQRDDGLGGFTNIPGANAGTFQLFARPADDGARFRVRAYMAGLIVDSRVVTLNLTPDTTLPTIQAALANPQGDAVVIAFSEAVASAGVIDLSNYTIVDSNGVAVGLESATLEADGRIVVLKIQSLEDSANYRLTFRGLEDLGEPPNTIEPTTVVFRYQSLVGHWRCNEGSGISIADESRYRIVGRLLNGAAWTPGLHDFALGFDGVNDRVELALHPALALTNSMTVAAWVYVESLSDSGRIVTKGGGPGQRGWSLNVESTDHWAFQVAISASVNISVNAPGVPLRRWTHVAGVYDASGPSLRLFTNGLLAGEVSVGVPGVQHNSSLNVSIGGRTVNQNFFRGTIDEVRINARPLDPTAILDMARPKFLPPVVIDGQIQLDWGGVGVLETGPSLIGPWTAIAPPPAPPYAELLHSGHPAFYRLRGL